MNDQENTVVEVLYKALLKNALDAIRQAAVAARPAEKPEKKEEAGPKDLGAKLSALETAVAEVKGQLAALRKPREKPAVDAAQLAAVEKRTLVCFAEMEGKAVSLPESVLEKMTLQETVAHLAALRPA